MVTSGSSLQCACLLVDGSRSNAQSAERTCNYQGFERHAHGPRRLLRFAYVKPKLPDDCLRGTKSRSTLLPRVAPPGCAGWKASLHLPHCAAQATHCPPFETPQPEGGPHRNAPSQQLCWQAAEQGVVLVPQCRNGLNAQDWSGRRCACILTTHSGRQVR